MSPQWIMSRSGSFKAVRGRFESVGSGYSQHIPCLDYRVSPRASKGVLPLRDPGGL